MTEPGPGSDRSGGRRADQPEGWGDEWDSVADVIVVGSGVAGMTAGGGGESWRLGHRPRAQRVHRWHHREVRRGPVDPEQLADARARPGRRPRRRAPLPRTDGLPRATTQSTRPSGSPPTSTLWRPSTTPARSPSRSSSPSGHWPWRPSTTPTTTRRSARDTAPNGAPSSPCSHPGGDGHRPHRRPAPRGPARAAAERLGATVLLEHRAAHVVRNDQLEVIGLEVQVGRRTDSSAPGAASSSAPVVSSTTSGSRWSSCAAL